MATSIKTHAVTVRAQTPLSAARFISPDGFHAVDSNAVIGVSEMAAASGRDCSCVTHYSALVVASEALSAGHPVKPAADGTGRAALGSALDCCGRALSDGAAGDLVEVQLMLQFGRRRVGPEPAYVPQYGVWQRGLFPTRRLQANATGLLWPVPCVLVGLECVENGSAGTYSLDDALVSDANNRLASAAFNATGVADGARWQMVGANAGIALNSGLYWTNTTGGQWWVDILDGTPIPGVEQTGALCAYTIRSASGIALSGSAFVHSLRVVTPGSAGALVPYSGQANTAGLEIGGPTAGYAYTALQANQLIPIGATLDKGLYLTLPTGGSVVVNYLPR